MRRVAGEGGLREMQLLRSRVGDAAIRDVIERTEARGLSPQRIRFWQLLLRLPARSVDAWVRAARASTWAGRASGVRVSFLEYRYPRLKPLVELSDLRLAALPDIAAMKLAAVAQRGSKKDFVDIFALGQRFGLAEMLGFYRAKYAVKDIGHVLIALAYFDDADRERMPTLLRRWNWSTMKSSIRRWVSDVTQAR